MECMGTNMVYGGMVGWCEQETPLGIRQSRICARHVVVSKGCSSDSGYTDGVSRTSCLYDFLRCTDVIM